MSTIRSARVPTLLAAALSLLATGCDGGSGPEVGSLATSPRELRRGLGAEPETLNPQQAADNASLAVVADLYEGLTAESADGRITPGAAASWSVSEDGLDWTFRLRPGLQWSNGDPLDARDFAAGIRSVIAPDSTAPGAGLLNGITDVATPDDLTVRIRLKRRVSYLPALLALPVASPLPRVAAGASAPVNGAYRLVEWRHGQYVELEKNPYFHGAGAVDIDRIRYATVIDLGTELNLYRTGELDVTSEVPNTMLPWARTHLPGELHVTPYLNTYAYAVNMARLTDVAARTALAMAIDRERITTQVTGAGEQPAYEWVAPGLPGYPGASFDWSKQSQDSRVAQARVLWRGAAARGGAPARLTLCTDASANHRRTAVALADQWRSALGVEVHLVELEWNVYLATRGNPGECDLVRLGWSADFIDPEAFATVFETGDPQDTLGYSSPRYDQLLARSRVAADEAARLRLLAQAESVLLEDVPVIPIFHRSAKRLVKPQVAGHFASPLGHLPSRDLRFGGEK